ncbi:BTB domain-containing protein [Favolaschia claudopus]|uniref:BTB domain-containing protein n=1 Tax=Favolaschia claudopus TaxID=2862362 RepID=A0AAV9ZY77_9AGAR
MEKNTVKVEGLWFSHEMIVIKAEHKLFRVPAGILSARSSVFSDMMAFPQPLDEERIDGTPVLLVQDTADGFDAFLRAVYDTSFFMPAPAPVDLFTALSILRLSHKYDIQHLHRRALDHLVVDGWYHQTYDDFRADNPDVHLRVIAQSSPINALSVISAATEVNALWFLPYAYYCASTFSCNTLLAASTTETQPYVQRCLLSHAALLRATVSANQFLATRCRKEMCRDLLECRLSDFFASVIAGSCPNPLADSVVDLKVEGICDSCYENAVIQQHEAVCTFWEDLPQLYGLPSWADLHLMKCVAMGPEDDVTGEGT